MSKSNIVLIGMMGCGKTTIGRILAKRLSKNFIDMDKYIEDNWEPIEELFKKGEPFFRKVESEAVKRISTLTDTVISTGGGVILKSENVENLKKNGIVVFVDRPLEKILEDIDFSKRPLIKDNKENLKRIFNERYKIYLSSCDFRVENSKDIEKVVNKLLELYSSKQLTL